MAFSRHAANHVTSNTTIGTVTDASSENLFLVTNVGPPRERNTAADHHTTSAMVSSSGHNYGSRSHSETYHQRMYTPNPTTDGITPVPRELQRQGATAAPSWIDDISGPVATSIDVDEEQDDHIRGDISANGQDNYFSSGTGQQRASPRSRFAPAALHTTFSSVQELESEDDEANQNEDGTEGSAARGWSPYGPTAERADDPHGTCDDEDDSGCHCGDVIGQLLRSGEYALCVEYGTSYLEQLQPGDVSLPQAQWVLCHLTRAYVRLSEMEHAKAVLALWSELLESSARGGGGAAACMSLVERQHWRVRLHLTTADLCGANGEREEAMQALVLAWRVQAYLHGPESHKCLSTYVRIAEIKIQLAQDAQAQQMVQHAAAQINNVHQQQRFVHATHMRSCSNPGEAEVPSSRPPSPGGERRTHRHHHQQEHKLLLLHNHVLRLQVVIAARQRRWKEALDLSNLSVEHLRAAVANCEALAAAGLTGASATTTAFQTEYRVLRTALGQALMRTAEVHHSSGAEIFSDNHATSSSAGRRSHQAHLQFELTLFAEGLDLISDCFPPTSEEVVRARLRLAALHALHDLHFKNSQHSAARSSVNSSTYWMQSKMNESAASHHQKRRGGHEATEGPSRLPSVPAAAPPQQPIARLMVQDVVSVLQQADVRGGKHVHLLIEAFEALADLEHSAGDFHSAATSYHKAKAAAGQLFAPDHERCAILQHKLAESLLAAGHWEDAVSLLHELKEWCLLCPAGVRPPVPLVVIHHSLGSAMRLAERFDAAEGFYRDALADEHIDFVTKTRVLGNLAALFLTRGDVDAAVHYNQLALTTRLARLGEWHQDVAASYANLAALYQRKKLPKQALFFSEKCLEVLSGKKAGEGGSRRNVTGEKVMGTSRALGSGGRGGELIDGVAAVRAWAQRTLRTPASST